MELNHLHYAFDITKINVGHTVWLATVENVTRSLRYQIDASVYNDVSVFMKLINSGTQLCINNRLESYESSNPAAP